MSWTLGLAPLTMAIASSPIADGLNFASKAATSARVDKLVEMYNKMGMGDLAQKLKMNDENGNVSVGSIAKGLMNVPEAASQVLEKSGQVINFLEKGVDQVRKVPIIGNVVADAVEAPLEETKKLTSTAAGIAKDVAGAVKSIA